MSHNNIDYMDSDPYSDPDLTTLANNRLDQEFREAETKRAIGWINQIDWPDYVYKMYSGTILDNLHVEKAKQDFINMFRDQEIDLILEERNQDAREHFADYLEDR
jgi:hypothetical protein